MRVAILGAGRHGRVIADLLRAQGEHEVVGWIDSVRPAGDMHLGLPVLGHSDACAELRMQHDIAGLVVAIGENHVRSKVVSAIEHQLLGIAFPSVVHPAAVVAHDAVIADGAQVMASAVIGSGAKVGRHCIINTLANVEHDCVVEDFASLAPQSGLAGGVTVGVSASICLGAKVIDDLQIGEYSVIGAGAVVLENIPPRVVAYGVPAKPIRSREPDAPVLGQTNVPRSHGLLGRRRAVT